MVTFLFFLHTPKQSYTQGGARAVDLPARSFDLARPGVAPPLSMSRSGGTWSLGYADTMLLLLKAQLNNKQYCLKMMSEGT